MTTNERMMALMRRAEAAENEASNIGYKEVERLAREIMKKHKEFKCFIMAMGSAFFSEGDNPTDDKDPRTKKLTEFLDMWCELKLTGMPMRLDSANGELKTDW